MIKRKTEAVIRFHNYRKDSDPSNYDRSRLMLYYPWYAEASDLLVAMSHMKSTIIMY